MTAFWALGYGSRDEKAADLRMSAFRHVRRCGTAVGRQLPYDQHSSSLNYGVNFYRTDLLSEFLRSEGCQIPFEHMLHIGKV